MRAAELIAACAIGGCYPVCAGPLADVEILKDLQGSWRAEGHLVVVETGETFLYQEAFTGSFDSGGESFLVKGEVFSSLLRNEKYTYRYSYDESGENLVARYSNNHGDEILYDVVALTGTTALTVRQRTKSSRGLNLESTMTKKGRGFSTELQYVARNGEIFAIGTNKIGPHGLDQQEVDGDCENLWGTGVYTVGGAVRHPGRYTFTPQTQPSVVGAISAAGGFTGNADARNVRLIRGENSYKINLLVVKGEQRRRNAILLEQFVGHGDHIVVGTAAIPREEQPAAVDGDAAAKP